MRNSFIGIIYHEIGGVNGISNRHALSRIGVMLGFILIPRPLRNWARTGGHSRKTDLPGDSVI